jgi:CRP/FNR family transcriptional regulator, anaerobic regulatory protein
LTHTNTTARNTMIEIIEAAKILFPSSLKIQHILQGHLKLKTYEKGEVIVKEGEIDTNLYFILSGFTRAFCLNEKKEKTTVWFMHEHNFVASLFSFSRNEPSTISIEATEKSKIILIKKKFAEDMFKKYPEVANLYRIHIEKYFLEIEESVISLQTKSAKERYESLVTKRPYILQRAPLGHIASFLGITQATLSRLRGKY